MKRLFSLLFLCVFAGTVAIGAVSSFYIIDESGKRIPFSTGGELYFENISGLPNQVTVFSSGGDLIAHENNTSIHFTQTSIDHTAIQNIGTNTHPQIDSFMANASSDLSDLNAHAADSTIHFPLSSILHDSLTGAAGYSNHSAIDAFMADSSGNIAAHAADTTIHYTQTEIDHDNLINVGTYGHDQLDAHVVDSTVHFTEGSIDHTAIQSVGTNTHAQIDSFITSTNSAISSLNSHAADSSIHFTVSSINHDDLSGASGYYNHSTINAHINDTSIHGGGSASIPAGTLWMFAGSTAPSGWMMADGSCVSRSTYSDLFAVVGETYDVCDGSTTFGLPDFRGRTGIGAGQGDGLTSRTLGDTPGEEAHVLTSSELPSNSYILSTGGTFWTYFTNSGGISLKYVVGGDAGHNTMQPSLAINYIIKY